MLDCSSGAFGLNRPFPAGPLISDIKDICEAEPEEIVPVRTARVAVANYRAILHDFPHVFLTDSGKKGFADVTCAACRARDRVCANAIDSWLIANAAFVSRQQSLPNEVNSPIDHGTTDRRAFRPPRYNRSLVVPIEEPTPVGHAGFLDIKGAGVGPGRIPIHAPHSNGLEYGGVALGDYFYGWLIDRVFRRMGLGYCTVPIYAVIDLGFDVVNGWMGTAPAALHVRRAHARDDERLPMSGGDEEKLMLQIEFILRLHGLTTAGPNTSFTVARDESGQEVLLFNNVPVDKQLTDPARFAEVVELARASRLELINIQLARGWSWPEKIAQLVDFGHVLGRQKFLHPFASAVSDTRLNVGHVLRPGEHRFPQPIKMIALDPDVCSRRSVNAYGFFAAQAFRSRDFPFERHDMEATFRLAMLRAFGRGPITSGRVDAGSVAGWA